MTCCGKDRKTPFCPICGATLTNTGDELLADLRKRLAGADARTARAAKLKRWSAWVEYVREYVREIPMTVVLPIKTTHDVVIDPPVVVPIGPVGHCDNPDG